MHIRLFGSCFLALILTAAGADAPAQTAQSQMKMQHQAHSAAPAAGDAAADEKAAFAAANEKMMRDMGQPLTGNVDQDFVAGMIPHHQGAIDMAEILLKYSKDPELRKLATGIIGAQKKEIAQMRAWQARHPK